MNGPMPDPSTTRTQSRHPSILLTFKMIGNAISQPATQNGLEYIIRMNTPSILSEVPATPAREKHTAVMTTAKDALMIEKLIRRREVKWALSIDQNS